MLVAAYGMRDIKNLLFLKVLLIGRPSSWNKRFIPPPLKARVRERVKN